MRTTKSRQVLKARWLVGGELGRLFTCGTCAPPSTRGEIFPFTAGKRGAAEFCRTEKRRVSE